MPTAHLLAETRYKRENHSKDLGFPMPTEKQKFDFRPFFTIPHFSCHTNVFPYHSFTVDIFFETTKLLIALVGIYFVSKQLYYNRTAAKDKLIYDINKGMEQYSYSADLIEKLRDLLRTKFTALTPPQVQIETKKCRHEIEEIIGTFTTNVGQTTPEKLARDNLRALETVMMMLETGVIKEDDIFPLIGYRIITLLNSPLIQSKFLFRKIKSKTLEGGQSLAQPSFRFAAVFALYDRVMIYNIKRFYNINHSDCFETGDFMEEFCFVPKYDLAAIEVWNYGVNEMTPENNEIFNADYWKRRAAHSEDELAGIWHFQDTGKRTPYEKALYVYNAHRPRRGSVWRF